MDVAVSRLLIYFVAPTTSISSCIICFNDFKKFVASLVDTIRASNVPVIVTIRRVLVINFFVWTFSLLVEPTINTPPCPSDNNDSDFLLPNKDKLQTVNVPELTEIT